MSLTPPALNYAPCTVRHVRHSLPSAPCEQCGKLARRVWEVSRSAIDIDLDHPVLLLVTVSVHHCSGCSRYFRVQPPFLRPNAVYTERVRKKAVLSVYEDGMAMRRVTRRLARDFWVSPSEAMVRRWCQDYAEGVDFEGDYQRWVVEEFSGVLCVDELYQDKLALLLAVDSAGEEVGDRLVGYELIHGRVDSEDVEKFLLRLREVGIDPDEVVTDGSPIYPKVLKEVWPTAAHQLCLFHESRLVTAQIYKALMALRKSIPKPPPVSQRVSLKGLPRKYPLPEKLAAHRAAIARVYALHEQGISIRGIRRRTGHSRNTIKRWLKGEIPRVISQAELPTQWAFPEESLGGEKQPEEYGSSPTRPPTSTPPEAPIVVPEAPPSPWKDWEEVRHVRTLLWKCRYIILRRPDHLSDEDQDELNHLFESAVGEHISLVRSFLEEWYLVFYDKQRNRRSLQEARERYDTLMRDPCYRKLEPLARLQARFDEAQFERISPFLRSERWEATNNGAERTARAFRHLQAPHYNFRKPESIERALRARASLSKEASPTGGPPLPGRSARGRKAKRTSEMPMAA